MSPRWVGNNNSPLVKLKGRAIVKLSSSYCVDKGICVRPHFSQATRLFSHSEFYEIQVLTYSYVVSNLLTILSGRRPFPHWSVPSSPVSTYWLASSRAHFYWIVITEFSRWQLYSKHQNWATRLCRLTHSSPSSGAAQGHARTWKSLRVTLR